MAVVIDLAAAAGAGAEQVGGKALGLGRLLAAGLDVPPGFVVTAGAYRRWLREHGLEAEVERLARGTETVEQLRRASDGIRALLERAGLADAAIDAAYARLAGDDPPVAVRSSASGEDGAEASFAGQQDTLRARRGPASVRAAVLRCWSSLFTPEAMAYRRRLGTPPAAAAMAVVVQRMVAPAAAGVLFTLDPRTGDPSQVTIESTHGLGLPLVGGELTPDRFGVDKVTLEIRSRAVARKPFADRPGPAGDGVVRVPLDDAAAAASSLSDAEVVRLAALGRQVERALGGRADVEWALAPGPSGDRHPYLLQARPETVWRNAAPAAPTTALQRIAAGLRRGA